MDKASSSNSKFEIFIRDWNAEFPNYELTIADLKTPEAVMGAILKVFDRLGIDSNAVLSGPLPEECRTENTTYYWDLLPVLNMTRILKHLVLLSAVPNCNISITHLLQPTILTSHSILLLLFNLMAFYEERLSKIAPYEKELFSRTEQVHVLEDRKNYLLNMLNAQAEEKGKRAERIEKLDQEVQQLEEELKRENEALEIEKQELEAIVKENRQADLILEQKRNQRDAILSEIEKKRALRVYDADDVRAQAEKATQDEKDAEAELNSLKSTLMQKETSLKSLQAIKPNLDTAIDLLHEVMKLSESLRDCENGDLDSDSKEGELDVLKTELSDLEAQLAELRVARDEAGKRRQESRARRQRDRTLATSKLHNAEEEDRKLEEVCGKATQRIQEIKQLTIQYEQEKAKEMDKINYIAGKFESDLKSMEAALLKKAKEIVGAVEDKLRNTK